jgi:hypothetical protein
MLKEIQQARRQRRREIYPRVARHGSYVALRAVTNVLLRDLNVSLIAEQMSNGASVIFCDFVDYDEVAHHAGPLRPEAMESLEGLDRVLGTLHRLADSAARPYEIVVLSDHGQSQGATFRQRYGETFEDVVTKLVHGPEERGDPSAAGGSNAEEWGRVNVLLTGMANQRGVKGVAVRVCAPEQRRDRLATGRPASTDQPVVTVASGNLAMIYLTGHPHRLTLEELDAWYPDLVRGLARHPGVGFIVVGSSADGPVAVGELGRHRLRDGHVEGIDPLSRYGPHAARDLLDHQRIAHVGDIVAVSRLDRGTDEVAAFEELVGSHGGIGGWQTEAVLVYPATWHHPREEIRGPDAVYRQLVGWLDELGLRATPDPSPEPEPESVSV